MRVWLAAGCVVTLLAVACGGSTAKNSGTPPTTTASGSPSTATTSPASGSRQQSPSPVAALKPCGTLPQGRPAASGQALVLARLAGSTSWVVRDVTDIANPVTLASLGDKWQWADKSGGGTLDARLPDPSTVVWADWGANYGNLIQSAPNGSSQRTLVSVTSGNAIVSFAWSPVSSDWTYLVNTPSGLEWHLVAGGSDRVLASLPIIPPHGGRPVLDPVMVGFSADGKLMAMIDYDRTGLGGSGDRAKMQIRRTDGSLVTTDAQTGLSGGLISDLLWVGSSLFFRDFNGIELWDVSGVCSALPGVQWIRPKLSPDGKRIVFATEDSSGLSHISVYDLSTKNVRQVSSGGGAEAWFLGSRYIWFLEERLCGATESCGVSNATLTGKSSVVDLTTGVSSQSRIARIADTWPRPGQPNFDNIWWMDAAAYA